MKQFGGVRVIARRVSSIPGHERLEEDRAIICAIPTNAEATLSRARREAIALLRSGDLNARTWEPITKVYICRSRIKEPSGVVGWRFYCLPQSLLDFFKGRFYPDELIEVYPQETGGIARAQEDNRATNSEQEAGQEPGGKPGRKPGGSTPRGRGAGSRKPVRRKR